MNDIIAAAQAKRDFHKAAIERLEAFLATAYEIDQELRADAPKVGAMSDAQKADAPRARVQAPAGAGSETVKAVVAIITDRGPLPTRDLLPLVRAKGIEVGGLQPIATLSARISGKGKVEVRNGKWHLIENSDAQAPDSEEATDQTAKEESAASLFNHNKGANDAAALA